MNNQSEEVVEIILGIVGETISQLQTAPLKRAFINQINKNLANHGYQHYRFVINEKGIILEKVEVVYEN